MNWFGRIGSYFTSLKFRRAINVKKGKQINWKCHKTLITCAKPIVCAFCSVCLDQLKTAWKRWPKYHAIWSLHNKILNLIALISKENKHLWSLDQSIACIENPMNDHNKTNMKNEHLSIWIYLTCFHEGPLEFHENFSNIQMIHV